MRLKGLARAAIEKSAETIAKTLLSLGKTGYAFVDTFSQTVEKNKSTVTRNGVTIFFNTPNLLSDWRVKTFESKEPETLDWIDSWESTKEIIFWDIGANMGLYSIYAALKKNVRVISIEASVFNCAQLVRNIDLNCLNDKISLINFPLSDKSGFGKMKISSTVSSSALSTFGEEYGWDGEIMVKSIEYSMLGLTGDDLSAHVIVPDYVKIDVDGIEHLILKGGINSILKAKEILVEVNDAFDEQSRGVDQLLRDRGFERVLKTHSEMIENSKYGFEKTYNQIWRRNNA